MLPLNGGRQDKVKCLVLEKGSRIAPSSLLLKDGKTSPPQPISGTLSSSLVECHVFAHLLTLFLACHSRFSSTTEVELISLMDRNGIGTDATIAQHIATILDRAYATKDASLKFHPTKLGIALVEGYNSMGYQLNKPDLRREMEHECNLVALGQKNKEAIMGPILNKMKQCFERANAEAHKLDEAVARHFSRLGTNNNTSTVLQANFSECGSCGNLMALKQGINNNNNQSWQQSKLVSSKTVVLWCLFNGHVTAEWTNATSDGSQHACQVSYLSVPSSQGCSRRRL